MSEWNKAKAETAGSHFTNPPLYFFEGIHAFIVNQTTEGLCNNTCKYALSQLSLLTSFRRFYGLPTSWWTEDRIYSVLETDSAPNQILASVVSSLCLDIFKNILFKFPSHSQVWVWWPWWESLASLIYHGPHSTAASHRMIGCFNGLPRFSFKREIKVHFIVTDMNTGRPW